MAARGAALKGAASIDFGTTLTCAATLDSGGRPVLLQHGSGTRMPSAVYCSDDGLVVGEYAANMAGYDRSRFDPTPKRLISSGATVIPISDSPIALEEVVASVVGQALLPLVGAPPARLVATHPAAWNDDQKAILRKGCELAGFANVDLIAEPVAAAWAMIEEDDRKLGAKYAIFDWGGGTFDAAVVAWDGTGFQVVGPPGGDNQLGGEDVDQLLLDHVLSQVSDETRSELDGPAGRARRLAHQLRDDVRRAKEHLSNATTARVQVIEEWVPVTRNELETLARSTVDRCVQTLASSLSDAHVAADRLEGVYLIGDASKMPLVVERIRDIAGVELPNTSAYDRKGVVALGALLADPRTSLTPARSPRSARIAEPGRAADVDEPPRSTQLPDVGIRIELDALAEGLSSAYYRPIVPVNRTESYDCNRLEAFFPNGQLVGIRCVGMRAWPNFLRVAAFVIPEGDLGDLWPDHLQKIAAHDVFTSVVWRKRTPGELTIADRAVSVSLGPSAHVFGYFTSAAVVSGDHGVAVVTATTQSDAGLRRMAPSPFMLTNNVSKFRLVRNVLATAIVAD